MRWYDAIDYMFIIFFYNLITLFFYWKYLSLFCFSFISYTSNLSMIRTCRVVIISQNELCTLREQIYHAFLTSNKK
jgi:uncharacterized membrane-anchored protein YitT (DUF2179 family)